MDRREFIWASVIGIGAFAIAVIAPLESAEPELIVCEQMITRLTALTWKVVVVIPKGSWLEAPELHQE